MTIPSKLSIWFSLGLAANLAGCTQWINPQESSTTADMTSPKDLAGVDGAPPARCRAAQGLTGKLLNVSGSGQDFCVDFDKVTDSELKASGWSLIVSTKGCSGFSINGGKLSINSLAASTLPDCQASLPQLDVPSGTSKIVVAIVHTLMFTSDTQYGQIEASSGTTQRSGWAGIGVMAPQVTSVEFVAEQSVFRGILRARNTSSMSSNLPDWQIQSIAVLGVQ